MRKLFVLLLCVVPFIPAQAQPFREARKARVQTGLVFHEGYSGSRPVLPVGTAGAEFMLTERFTAGFYGGFARNNLSRDLVTDGFAVSTILAGGDVSFYLLPLHRGQSFSRFGVYVKGKAGIARNDFSDLSGLPDSREADYGLYAGVEWELNHRFGLFGEAGYGNLNLFAAGLYLGF